MENRVVMTAEEFIEQRFEFPEAGQWSELEAGQVVHLQPPDVDHGTVVLNLSKALAEFAQSTARGYACFDLGLQLRTNPDTVRFPAIAKAMLTLPCESALLDGEVAFVLPSGITDFKSLQDHIDSPHPAIRYFVFDLLSLDGKDWRKKPLKERRAALAQLMSEKGISNYLVYADYVEGSGPEFFAQASAARLSSSVCMPSFRFVWISVSIDSSLLSRMAARTGSFTTRISRASTRRSAGFRFGSRCWVSTNLSESESWPRMS